MNIRHYKASDWLDEPTKKSYTLGHYRTSDYLADD